MARPPVVRQDDVRGAARTGGLPPLAIWVAAWLVPGAGHALVGQLQKAVLFFVVLIVMFVVGIWFGGRLFPFQLADPLVFLAALAEWAMALPRLLAGFAGAGKGQVTVITYEYGNTFLIASGLLNLLVAFNAFDVATGRK